MSIDRKITDPQREIIASVRHATIRHGYHALIAALSGDPAPNDDSHDAVLQLRNSLFRYLSEIGYWRANLHEYRAEQEQTFTPWRPGLDQGNKREGLRLPFIDLQNQIFRTTSDRKRIEDRSGWYDHIGLGKEARNTSSRLHAWLKWWLRHGGQQNDDDPIAVISPGETFALLILYNPELLPLPELKNPKASPLSEDGIFALEKSKRLRTVFEMAAEAGEWLKESPPYNPTGFWNYLSKRLDHDQKNELIEVLTSGKPDETASDFIRRLSSSNTYKLVKQQVLGWPESLRFQLDEPFLSGTRSVIFWPVSSFSSFSWSPAESRIIYCAVVLQPDAKPDENKVNAIRSLIESILVQTVPSATADAVAVEALNTRSRNAYRLLNHQFRNVVQAAREATANEVSDAGDDARANSGDQVSRVVWLLDTFSHTLDAASIHAESDFTNTLITKKIPWKDFGQKLSVAFSRQSTERQTPLTMVVEDHDIANREPDVRLHAIAWELVRNASKHVFSDPSHRAWRRWLASGAEGARAKLSIRLIPAALVINCESEPHHPAIATRIHKAEFWQSGSPSGGVRFIGDLCNDLGRKVIDSHELWHSVTLETGFVRVIFSCDLSLLNVFPGE